MITSGLVADFYNTDGLFSLERDLESNSILSKSRFSHYGNVTTDFNSRVSATNQRGKRQGGGECKFSKCLSF